MPAETPDLISYDSLEWALTHLERFGSSDLLPPCFEFEAIRHHWTRLRAVLQQWDFAKHKCSSCQPFLIPKPGNGFRIAAQLDCLDSILYTAAVHEVGATIEANRIPADQRIACSYRICPTPNGSFFPAEDGWSDFHGQSRSLSASSSCTHVVIADIADFYNQVYVHRVETSLQSSLVPCLRAKSLERFLFNLWGAAQSQGIPVGPAASIVLAEALMNDVDSMLIRKGYKHVRYVDDFRVFCDSKQQALAALHALTAHLYTAHRLSLQGGKTRILTKEEFTRDEMRDPKEDEEQTKLEKLQKMIEEIAVQTGYDYTLEDLTEANENEAARVSLRELFGACIGEPVLPLGVAKYLLRRALKLRARNILGLVVENLDRLTPAFRDTMFYLKAVLTESVASQYRDQLLDFAQKNPMATLPYVANWLLWLFVSRPYLISNQYAFELGSRHSGDLGIRPLALLMGAKGNVDFVREHKERWRSYPALDRRALIYSASILPNTERRAWLNVVIDDGDPADSAVAHFVLSRV